MPNPLRIHTLLKNKIGLDVQSIGENTVARAIRHRMAAVGITNLDLYAGRLQVSPQELDELIEQVIVPETWFFRNPESFRFLHHYASERKSVFARKPMNALSIPCASGEEAYSIAITLLNAGLTRRSFSIDAVDISAMAINKAEKALYGENSFRGSDIGFRKHYFQETLDGSLLKPILQKQVKFARRNLFEIHDHSLAHAYDVIFCRNLLIYLDAGARRRALRILHRLLNPEGLLFVGHSEAGLPLLPFFRAIRPLKAFAHQKNLSNRD